MTNLISRAVAHIGSVLKDLHFKRFLAIAIVGFVVLTTNVDGNHASKAVTKSLDRVVHQDNSERPKTTGEWNQEARETKGDPGERIKRIGKESAEAVKDFGSVYPSTAKRSARELKENTK
ncbi:hypothetical protein [Fortiea contorta]|uniref:hypothetical protein n=1 Tax=Fortiea contorta TaxID=1892405 RepID=UPI00034D03EE|nr:hypothetical protein [Fortiea contorta]